MKRLICAVMLAICAAPMASSGQDRPVRPERPERPARPAAAAPLERLAPLSPLTRPEPQDDRQNWSFSTSDGWRRLRIEAHGRIELTDDERDVKSVSPQGSLEISSKGWLSLFGQRYVVRGNADGTTTRRFTVGGLDKPIDSEARAWIAGAIDRLVASGFGAEARIARIIAQRGAGGVLDEISRFGGAYFKAQYFVLLFKQAPIDRPTADRALRQAGMEIGSAFELARVLIAFAGVFPIDDAIAPSFLAAANSIGSSYEQARVLEALIAGPRSTPAAVKVVLDATPRIGSDYEKAEVLDRLARRQDLGADAVIGLVRATTSIGSAYEQSRVLLQVVRSQAVDAATRQALLDATARIGSDHERGRVMSAMLREGAPR